MNVQDVMEELAAKASAVVPRSFAYPPDKISPPTFLIELPEKVDFDGAYDRGMDSLTLPAMMLVGRSSDRSSVKNLLPYLAGSGDQSVKQALESGPYTAMDTVQVAEAELGFYRFADIEYLGAEFTINITGSGA